MLQRTVSVLGTSLIFAALLAAGPLGYTAMAADLRQITGNGTAKSECRATLLRMHVQVVARGKNLEEALAKFQQRREALLAQIEKAGADKHTLALAGPKEMVPSDNQRRRMEMMVMQRMGKKAKAKPAAALVAVSGTLTAQWPLEGDTTEKLLLAADAIRSKLKAIDLAGAKEAGALTAEEQELAEEAGEENQPNPFGNDEGPKPGEPIFLYVAKIQKADRQKLLAQAFAKAKAQAEDLAKAAEVELGPLDSLMQQAGFQRYYNNMSQYGGFDRRAYAFMQQAGMETEEVDAEVLGPSPDGLSFQVAVMASFAIKK